MNKIKFAIAIFFVASVLVGLSGKASAFPPFVGKAKKFGAKDCTFCHVDPLGGPPWNDRGKWLVEEKNRRNADAIDVEWLADYKPSGGKPNSAAKPAESKPAESKPAASSSTSSSASNVDADLLKLEREWLDAYMKRDIAALERIEADDFTLTRPTGEVVSKAQELAIIRSNTGGEGAFKLNTQDTKVRVYGDTAVLTGVVIQNWTDNGKEMTMRVRYTDVWVKRNGRWQVVASQLTKIPDSSTIEKKPQETQAKKVDSKIYDAYVGEYETPIFIIMMTKEGDKLFGQPQGESKEELVLETETRYRVTNVNAIVTFVKDADGKVTGLEIEMNGQQVKGKKIK